MTFNKETLPTPPEFPASNASYNSIVGKMHKAALLATSIASAAEAVTMIRNHVTGTNTYAKATRRYAGVLLDALAQLDGPAIPLPAVDEKTGIPLTPTVAKMKAKSKATAEKPAAKRKVKRGAIA